jgi:hypothetical protein
MFASWSFRLPVVVPNAFSAGTVVFTNVVIVSISDCRSDVDVYDRFDRS